MSEVLSTFGVAFLFSFIGTIPPGTLNLTVIQLGLNHRINAAWRMALAAALIEYPYAWIAVEFQDFLSQSLEFRHNFHLVSAIVMVALGVINLWASAQQSTFLQRFEASGFRKGIVLSLLNPLAIPFWMAMTAYLKTYDWIKLSNQYEVHAYLIGVCTGTLALLMILAFLARKVVNYFKSDSILKKIPGTVLILLGFYSFAEYIFG